MRDQVVMPTMIVKKAPGSPKSSTKAGRKSIYRGQDTSKTAVNDPHLVSVPRNLSYSAALN